MAKHLRLDADVRTADYGEIAELGAEVIKDFLERAGIVTREQLAKAMGQNQKLADALEKAGVALTDLSFVETHDCFTVAELIEYEAMGLTPRGQGARAIKEGWTQKDGKLPINPSGGLKAKGHPIGATGVSMHVMTAMQLAGQAQGPLLLGGDIGLHDTAAAALLDEGGEVVVGVSDDGSGLRPAGHHGPRSV